MEELIGKHFNDLPTSVKVQVGRDYLVGCMDAALPHRQDLVDRLDVLLSGGPDRHEANEVLAEIVEEAKRRGAG